MSLAATQAVWTRSKAEGSARLLMLALADFSQDKHEPFRAWPSYDRLAAHCRCSSDWIKKLVKAQVKAGELVIYERSRGTHSTNKYRFVLPESKGENSPPIDEADRGTIIPMIGGRLPPRKGDDHTPYRGTIVPPNSKERLKNSQSVTLAKPTSSFENGETDLFERLQEQNPHLDISSEYTKAKAYYAKHTKTLTPKAFTQWVENDKTLKPPKASPATNGSEEAWERFLRAFNQPIVPRATAPEFLRTRFITWRAENYMHDEQGKAFRMV